MTNEKYYATITLTVAVNKEQGDTLTDTVNKLGQSIKKFDFNGTVEDYSIESISSCDIEVWN
jgi:hypothetical protein